MGSFIYPKNYLIMLSALFSINPQYAEQIFDGKKLFEFRKQKCKRTINKMVIYETSPISKIIGEVDVLDILEDTPENIWNITSKNSGISLDFFNSYFKNRKVAYAYVLSNPVIYKKPICLKELNIKAAPQSYIYIDYTQYEKLH